VIPALTKGAVDQNLLLFELSRNRIFERCRVDLLQALALQASVYTATRGARIAKQGRPFPYLGFVCDGVVGTTLNVHGPSRGVHQLRLYEASAGSLFGVVAVLGDSASLGDIAVLSRSATYALLPSSAIAKALLCDTTLMQRLASLAAETARQLAHRLSILNGWSVTSRVARVLMEYASDADGLKPADDRLCELTQQDIAAAAGCVKEAAARAVAELETEGALRRRNGHIRFLNRTLLAKR
jgi:CRP-like cAMP-binding protein